MSFEDSMSEAGREGREKKISGYKDAVDYLLDRGAEGAMSEPFQEFVEREENKVSNHIQGLKLAFRLAVVYYLAGFRDYALESLGEIEEAENPIKKETDLFDRLRTVKEQMEAGQEIGLEFLDE